MLTIEKLRALEIGDFILDMHDGLTSLMKVARVHSTLRWEGPPAFGPGFGNKELRVLGFNLSLEHENAIVAGYSYDGHLNGIVVFELLEEA